MDQSVDEYLDYDSDELRLQPFNTDYDIVVTRGQTVLKQNVPDEHEDDENAYVDAGDHICPEDLFRGADLAKICVFIIERATAC